MPLPSPWPTAAAAAPPRMAAAGPAATAAAAATSAIVRSRVPGCDSCRCSAPRGRSSCTCSRNRRTCVSYTCVEKVCVLQLRTGAPPQSAGACIIPGVRYTTPATVRRRWTHTNLLVAPARCCRQPTNPTLHRTAQLGTTSSRRAPRPRTRNHLLVHGHAPLRRLVRSVARRRPRLRRQRPRAAGAAGAVHAAPSAATACPVAPEVLEDGRPVAELRGKGRPGLSRREGHKSRSYGLRATSTKR